LKKDLRSDLLKGFGMESRVFTWLESVKRNVAPGEKIYNLTAGAPDGIPETEMIEALRDQALVDKNHTYAPLTGLMECREAVAKFYQERYHVSLDPKTEILIIPGAKRALIDLVVDFANQDKGILVPNICYPTYRIGGKVARVPQKEYRLDPGNNFAPVYEDLDRDDVDIMFMNYPHNPTCAAATPEIFEKTVALAKKNGYIVCHDNAYGEILFDGKQPISFMQAEGARELGVEIFTFSKVFSVAGWRAGAMVGNADIIKIFLDSLADYASGVFCPVEYGVIKGIDVFFTNQVHEKVSDRYQERRDTVAPILESKGWKVYRSEGAMYLWAKIPVKDSMKFTENLWDKAKVLVTPGIAYGDSCNDCIRIGLVYDKNFLAEAANAIPAVGDDIYNC